MEERKRREEEAKAKQLAQLKAQREAREAQARADYEKAQKEKQKREMDRLVAQELAAQKKDEENRAHRAKMDAIDKRLKEKQEMLKKIEAD